MVRRRFCPEEANIRSKSTVKPFPPQEPNSSKRSRLKLVPDFARARGARALEGYPMLTEPGKEITWGELHVGSRNFFADAGMRQVAAPTKRRVVMRIDF